MSCKNWKCPTCGDRLIHQHLRGAHESSSAFGQFVHDRVTKKTTFSDVDHTLIYRESSLFQLHFNSPRPPTVRILEHKRHGGVLADQQLECAVMWVQLVEMGVRAGVLSIDSGAFLVYADPPFDHARVCRMTERSIGSGRDFTGAELIAWLGMKAPVAS